MYFDYGFQSSLESVTRIQWCTIVSTTSCFLWLIVRVLIWIIWNDSHKSQSQRLPIEQLLFKYTKLLEENKSSVHYSQLRILNLNHNCGITQDLLSVLCTFSTFRTVTVLVIQNFRHGFRSSASHLLHLLNPNIYTSGHFDYDATWPIAELTDADKCRIQSMCWRDYAGKLIKSHFPPCFWQPSLRFNCGISCPAFRIKNCERLKDSMVFPMWIITQPPSAFLTIQLHHRYHYHHRQQHLQAHRSSCSRSHPISEETTAPGKITVCCNTAKINSEVPSF